MKLLLTIRGQSPPQPMTKGRPLCRPQRLAMQTTYGTVTQFVFSLFLVITLSPAYASQVTSGVSFAQVSFTGSNPPEMYSHYGQISVDFNMLYGEGYINVERYANGKAAGWVVKNLPVISGSILPDIAPCSIWSPQDISRRFSAKGCLGLLAHSIGK